MKWLGSILKAEMRRWSHQLPNGIGCILGLEKSIRVGIKEAV